MADTVCPRCGHRNSFIKGFLPETCLCRVCQSQLDWREIPGAGADCTALPEAEADVTAVRGGPGEPPSPTCA